jgi:hypothetical protein
VQTGIGLLGIVVGVSMLGQWAVALARRRVPELQTRPIEIRLHLIAEFATGIVLIVGGLATVIALPVGPPLFLFALGMLTYTAIVSPGYFWARGERPPVVMFALIIVGTIIAAIWLIASLSG